MLELEASYRRLPGTRAAVGQSGVHCVIADRPEGRAGGGGGGFNGGQLLALSLGACYCNDLQYVAEELGVEIEDLDVRVLIDFHGQPTVAREIEMRVSVTLADGGDPAQLIESAAANCTIANTLRTGTPVSIVAA
ncbi:OsmC family protein [Sphingomonas sp.]|uniref:OsmC family protein n=1 Tax=Sphingomonas sp. TaxID=28214 RepID=UPI0026010F48|nr:OsmC family protein [Sphingomonas sp.]MBV9527868.1 OsmC family protein [Sphingomonas sp.]